MTTAHVSVTSSGRWSVDDVIVLRVDSRQTSVGPRPPVTERDTPATWRPRAARGTTDDCTATQDTRVCTIYTSRES